MSCTLVGRRTETWSTEKSEYGVQKSTIICRGYNNHYQYVLSTSWTTTSDVQRELELRSTLTIRCVQQLPAVLLSDHERGGEIDNEQQLQIIRITPSTFHLFLARFLARFLLCLHIIMIDQVLRVIR
jgi:hypothetical protein